MANALEQAKDEMDEYEFKQWQAYKNRVTYNSALFDVEREEIVSFLEEKHIWYVPWGWKHVSSITRLYTYAFWIF